MVINPVTLFDDPTLSDEFKLLQSSVRTFVEKEVAPFQNQYYWQDVEFADSLLQEIGRLGYLGVGMPESAGGNPFGVLGLVIVGEELGRCGASLPVIVNTQCTAGTLLLRHGTDEQKRKYIRRIASGELLCAHAGTEPDAGSDAANVKTTAVRDGNFYILNGTKTFCTFAGKARLLFTYVRTDQRAKPKHRGISCIIIEKEPGERFDPPGLTGRAIPLIGYQGRRTYELSFQDYRVPAENILGGEAGLNRGFYQLMTNYDLARVATGGSATGAARAAYEAAVSYAANRVQFEYPIINFQTMRFYLAEMATDILAAKRLTYYVAGKVDAGEQCHLEAGMLKLFVTEVAKRCTDLALQIHGGVGFTRELPVGGLWLWARVGTIVEGPSEVQKRLIANELLGKAVIDQ